MTDAKDSLADMIESALKEELKGLRCSDGDGPLYKPKERVDVINASIKWEQVKRGKGGDKDEGYGEGLDA